jgi:hypothetical protein
MSGSGRGGSNRRNKHRFSGRKDETQKSMKKSGENPGSGKTGNSGTHERPRYPITSPDCIWCKKPIKDITTAISDKETGNPVHFDCVVMRIADMEHLKTNESVCYIGGGRFGIVHCNNPPDMRDFTIKKIIEWEIKEKEYEWRKPISEYYSLI